MCRLDMLIRVNRRSCAGMVIVGSVDSSQGSELLDGVRASTLVVGAPEDFAWTSVVAGVLEIVFHSRGKRSMKVLLKKGVDVEGMIVNFHTEEHNIFPKGDVTRDPDTLRDRILTTITFVFSSIS